jgi:hypothetical protein
LRGGFFRAEACSATQVREEDIRPWQAWQRVIASNEYEGKPAKMAAGTGDLARHDARRCASDAAGRALSARNLSRKNFHERKEVEICLLNVRLLIYMNCYLRLQRKIDAEDLL